MSQAEKPEEMPDHEYQLVQDMIVSIAMQVSVMRLPEFLERITLAHTVGPVLDPTLYRKAMGRLDNVESAARLLNAFRTEVLKQKAEAQQAKAKP